jgi:hypothetical protein
VALLAPLSFATYVYVTILTVRESLSCGVGRRSISAVARHLRLRCGPDVAVTWLSEARIVESRYRRTEQGGL